MIGNVNDLQGITDLPANHKPSECDLVIGMAGAASTAAKLAGQEGAGRILSAFLDDLPGGAGVNTEAVAAALPERTSGSDIREIIRRALLAGNGEAISTAALLAEVGTGRYRAEPPGGMYL